MGYVTQVNHSGGYSASCRIRTLKRNPKVTEITRVFLFIAAEQVVLELKSSTNALMSLFSTKGGKWKSGDDILCIKVTRASQLSAS